MHAVPMEPLSIDSPFSQLYILRGCEELYRVAVRVRCSRFIPFAVPGGAELHVSRQCP